MRDIERIDDVLFTIRAVWQKNPDLRLGQLLLNVARDPQLYYIEDKELAEKVVEFYERA